MRGIIIFPEDPQKVLQANIRKVTDPLEGKATLPIIGVIAAFSLLIGMRLKNIDFTLSLMASSLVLGFTAEKPRARG